MTGRRKAISCAEAAEKLYEYLDGELQADDTERIRLHIRQCARCYPVFNFEKTYLRFLEARGRARGAPPALKRRILEELLENQDHGSE